jgi:hypothetical protein
MDRTTQQNAALVEQIAAAASSLRSQAKGLVRDVSTFQIIDERRFDNIPFTSSDTAIAPRPQQKRPLPVASKPVSSAKPVTLPKPVAQQKSNQAGNDQEWDTF